MKKFLGFLIFIFLLNSCNDGDVAVQDISFESAIGAECGNTIYKIKGNEILFFKIKPADFEAKFLKDQSEANKPRTVIIDAENTVTYRVYNGPVTGANVCEAGTATPSLVEEWTATGGSIEITSTISKTTSTATSGNTNAETIDGYNFLIVFRNITFKKPNGEQFYEEFRFGNYKSSFDKLDFSVFESQPLKECASNKNLTSKNGITSLISFDNTSDLIKKVLTNGTPRVAAIPLNNNLYYRVFDNLNVTNYDCTLTYAPTDITLKQEWKATSGTVEVFTTSSGAVFIHKAYLKGVKFKKGNSEFYLGDNFYLGELQQ